MRHTKFIRLAALVLLPVLVAALWLYPGRTAENAAASVTKAAPEMRTIVKEAGAVITLPQYNNGDTLKIIGAALAAEDWAVLRDADKMYALILGGDTTKIPDYAFCDKIDELGCATITSITALQIRSVGDGAFSGNSALGAISLPAAVEIGRKAFQACHSLRSVTLPAAEKIQYGAFSGCHSLSSVFMPEATCIGGHAFSSNPALKEVSLPAAVQIDENAFQLCGALTGISLPAVTHIMEGAFFECEALAEISLPQALFIGNEAFMSCERLAEVSLPEVVVICAFSFQGCKSLTEISLPMAEDIDRGAFVSCESLAAAFLPMAEKVGESAFYFCGSLRSVSLPNVRSIGEFAFSVIEGKGDSLVLELGARPEISSLAFVGRENPVTLVVPKNEQKGYGDVLAVVDFPEGSEVTAK